ncbi:polysaccharide deacetylase family protein [Methylobacterium haplocladii]|uniref:Chitooligosaccharide deacetylase n=1 Tax=Methylobacterium haplocladii TaxID=1176176 RepID=A0A512IN88_9HYPH|nr:polysaccharide deacetylase family protein [Methylobacterium haplocladii]GEO99163.1 xylanase [Methylobacterium haplocladii]GJD83193.1 hypothetical protein HPGCJGGD_1058 [Methylobacterium haplocladii]GLS58513.1 xylanase [Methylobacterium haplocladii]
MLTVPPDGDVARIATLRVRLAHRLARHLRTSPAVLAPATPLVSFTFDDAPVCACTVGADMLDASGAKGTFYISGGLIDTRALHWRTADEARIAALHAAGHEIGSHTYSHVFVPNLGPDAIAAESRRNDERLRTIVPGLALESFAFPYGFGSISAKRALSGLYRTSRGIVPGINVGRTDLHFLRANPLMDGHLDIEGIAGLMDAACACNGWLIFYGHDVVDDPSPYGCSPALLEAALRAASDRGIPCVSVAEGLRRSL